jgi:PadR family transcriptional regulator, regulatory protein AphA
MARGSAHLLPAEYALLGLLAAGPAHGYDLHRAFAPGGELAEVCRVPITQLYAMLKKLASRDLVHERGAEATGTAPPRRLFALTPQGERVLAEWLAGPVPHTREVRLEFLLKLYFAGRRDPAQVAALLAAQHAETRTVVSRLQNEIAALGTVPPADFRRLVVDVRLRQNQAVLAWLEDALRVVAA